MAKKNHTAPVTDHTGLPVNGTGNARPAVALDGEPSRVYDDQGSGLSKVSGLNYNETFGRKANAPTAGGDRQAAYDALLSKSGGKIPAAYRRTKKAKS